MEGSPNFVFASKLKMLEGELKVWNAMAFLYAGGDSYSKAARD